MRQKKLSVLAMTAVAAFTLSACSSSGDDGSSDGDGASTDKLTVGIKFDQPGLGLQKGSEYSGFDVDVAYYVADKLGYSQDQVEFVQSVTAQRETMLENGQADMIVATYTMSDARKEQIDFAGPYLAAGQSLLVAADDDSISGPDNFMDGRSSAQFRELSPPSALRMSTLPMFSSTKPQPIRNALSF